MQHFKIISLACLLGFWTPKSFAKKLNISSARLSFSMPATAHNLVLQKNMTTTFFDLEPKNNERIGIFLKVNSLLLGYSLDPFSSEQETKTTHIDIITEKHSGSRVGFNIQTLKGFDSKARSFETNQQERRFFSDIESQRLEVFGLHNLKTFYGTSLFDHFFLNRPKEGATVCGLSLVGEWKVRHLKLSSPSGVIYTPSFDTSGTINQIVPEIKALSVSSTAGPMLSVGFKNRMNAFLSTGFGLGYFENLTDTTDLKKSGFEFLQSYSGGFSWNSNDKKIMVNSKLSYQRGRHIETTFGNLTLLYFF